MPCGMYCALPAAGCVVMGMTGGGGSGVSTLGGATSLEFNLGVTPGDGTWHGLIRCERRGGRWREIVQGYGLAGVETEFEW
jgi:hypothetical protein